jgi:hypothetical protein
MPSFSTKNSTKGYKVKQSLLRPAVTSQFTCTVKAPTKVHQNMLRYYGTVNIEDHLIIPCSETTLPGSSLATHELNNDFTGVTQRHAYRALYDDRVDITFLVNHEYIQIRYFDAWMKYIKGEQIAYGDNFKSFRMRYPEDYKTKIIITAESRDKVGKIEYTFIDAFPISMASMPMSYDSSQLLKCTVSFSYDRYILGQYGSIGPSSSSSGNTVQGQSTASGVPSSNAPSAPADPGAPPAPLPSDPNAPVVTPFSPNAKLGIDYPPPPSSTAVKGESQLRDTPLWGPGSSTDSAPLRDAPLWDAGPPPPSRDVPLF